MTELQQQIREELGKQLLLAVEGMLSETWKVSPPGAVPPRGMPVQAWSQTIRVGGQSLLEISVAREAWREVGRRAAIAVGMEGAQPAEIESTGLEILNQAVAAVARILGGQIGAELSFSAAVEAPLTSAAGSSAVRIESPDGWITDVYFRIEPTLTEQLQRAKEVDPAAQTQTAPVPPTLDLLLDVEMPVSVSFGRARLPLKEVVKLSTGSIIELNRSITEPVEVIVNNCVVARGEVVVVDGNYGVRIHQIVSRAERLRSID